MVVKIEVDLHEPLVFQVGHLGEAYDGFTSLLSARRALAFLQMTIWRANTMHYLLHGCHHKHPMDALRLVFPPAATAILCVPFWSLIRLFSTPSVAPALFGGLLLGYVMYDTAHYYLHHGQPSTGIPKKLMKYHLNHHFRAQTKGFGITSSL